MGKSNGLEVDCPLAPHRFITGNEAHGEPGPLGRAVPDPIGYCDGLPEGRIVISQQVGGAK